jgi:hypothetical protein
MGMDVQFVGLTVAIPDDWEDRSTITFQLPPDPALVSPLAGSKNLARSPGNVVIQWSMAGSSADPAKEEVEGQLSRLPSILEGFRTIATGELDVSNGPLRFIEYTFQVGGEQLHQILCARKIGSRVVVVTGTALAPQFKALRARFVDVALSVRAV